MKSHSLRLLFPVIFLALSGGGVAVDSALAQGLLGIGEYGSEISETTPFRIAAGVRGGYDSNTNTAPDDERVSSYFGGGGLDLYYAFANKTTRLDIGGNLSALYYDQTATDDNVFYNGRFTVNLGHRISERMRLTNNGMVAYEIEPDFLIAASSSLRDDQYLFWFNRTALWYELTPRISSVTSYTIQGIDYESGPLRDRENRLTQLIGQQLRYALTRQTNVRAEYRYAITDYDVAPYDSTSHYVLAGVDHQFSDYTTGSLAGGAEYRMYDIFDNFWKPYGEAGVRHRLSDVTYLRWMFRAGLENNEVVGFRDRYTYRTGIDLVHQLADKIRLTTGVAYINSNLNGEGVRPDVGEDGITAQAGLAYRLLKNLELTAGYFYTQYDSDEAYRNYDRHRISVGANAEF